ncbi:phasin [Prosthecodimorpha staleyi]|uniref:Phasin n=1 Tax=Prosthecodimorpha staleyi TaxID=2840188 RepID=A0A947D1L6_9HYPH|nr:phasin [Prosthecodimorpha staleyi]MBT9289290.1 phasin [Prosthecodimorpha staleyi]
MTDIESKPTAKKTAPKTASTDKVVPFELPKIEMPKFEMPKFEMPKVDFAKMPQVEVPQALRDVAEKTVAQVKANYEKIKVAAEETTDLIEDTFETARAGAVEYNLKTLDALKANTDAAFAFAKDLAGAKTFAEAIELQTAFVRHQFESVTAQAKDLQSLATKVATETAQPVKDAVSKTFKAA